MPRCAVSIGIGEGDRVERESSAHRRGAAIEVRGSERRRSLQAEELSVKKEDGRERRKRKVRPHWRPFRAEMREWDDRVAEEEEIEGCDTRVWGIGAGQGLIKV